jgi:REP element-mobilizing transposase RayT
LFGEIVGEEMRLNKVGEIVQEEWLRTGEIREDVELDSFVVMPNHVHGIIVLTEHVGANCNSPQEKHINNSSNNYGKRNFIHRQKRLVPLFVDSNPHRQNE